ncbi:Homeodomain-like [Penicillium digitatum]|uniref:Homeodomain-like n=2 Tax=Penicillium digitatum TaxID=36651 RepID=A0A7T6XTF9_PENDI|nr:Homeodomain-like [Penicillium digitatum]
MAPINLDDIIHNHPPVKRPHFKPLQHIRLYTANTAVWVLHSRAIRRIFKFAEEVTIDCSNEFDMDVLNAFSGKDANVAISNIHTASRELQKVHSQTEADEIADEATMEGDTVRHSNPTIDIADGNTMVNGHILDPAGQEKQSTPTRLLPGDAGIEADELRLEPAACVIGESMPAERYNKQPVSESYVVISQEKNRAAAHDDEGGLQRRDAESLSASPKLRQNGILARSSSPALQGSEKQSPCSPTKEVTGFCPVLDQAPVLAQPSVVISNFRPQERGTKDSVSITRMASPNRKRDRDEYISDDSSDDPDGPDDADYVGESGEDAHGNSIPSHRLKRARRAAVQLKPRPPRQNTKRLSVDEAVQPKVAADQTSPTSLHDIETIHIRGFLTR